MKLIIVAFAFLFVARDSQARMVCDERPSRMSYNVSAHEMDGGTCGPFPKMLAYADRNKSVVYSLFNIASESKLSANKCVETVQGLARRGIIWKATESWNDTGTYGFAHYKISQDYQGQQCQSEYIVKFNLAAWKEWDSDGSDTRADAQGST